MQKIVFFFKNLDTQEWILLITIFLLFVALVTLVMIIVQSRKPKPIITVDEEDGVLKYKNIGDDSAIDIQTEEVSLNLFSIFFSPVNLMQPDDKLKLEPKVTGRTPDAEYYLGACKDMRKEPFPYFEGHGVYWYTFVTHYKSTKGKKYLSVVLVRCKTKKVEHKLNGRKWWINFLDKFKLIRNFPKPPKDAPLYKSD